MLKQRIGGALDASAIAAMPEDDLVEVFRDKPALHRYPANMAKRTQALCAYVASEYDGDAAAVWEGAENGRDLHKRLLALPGFGAGKVGTTIAILGKRLGLAPSGWEERLPDHMTLGDVESFEGILEYRETKRAMKEAAG